MKKILFAGEGGQGVQVVAEIIASAAFSQGKYSTYIPNFGVEQRGGVSIAFVIIDDQPIFYPKFEFADLAIIFSNRSKERIKEHLGPQTKIILGPAVENGLKTKLPPKAWNLFLLGRVNHLGKLVSKIFLTKEMEKRFAHQFINHPELKKLDFQALDEGER